MVKTDQQLIETISEQIESARNRSTELSPEIESKSKKKLGDLKIRKANAEPFVWVYRYYSQKKLGLPSVPQHEMQNRLNKKFPSIFISLRTINKWCVYLKDTIETLSDSDKEKIRPVMWHRLEEYGLPWEASKAVGDFQAKYGCYPSRGIIMWWWRLKQLRTWDADQLLNWAHCFEGREIREMFKVPAESFSELEIRMFNSLED